MTLHVEHIPMPEELEKLAGELSEADREFLGWTPDPKMRPEPAWLIGQSVVFSGFARRRPDLIEATRTAGPKLYRLTPLGLALRNYLSTRKDEG